jgi:hypothetical protein
VIAMPQIDDPAVLQVCGVEMGASGWDEKPWSGVEEDFGRLGFEQPLVVGDGHGVHVGRVACYREFIGKPGIPVRGAVVR